MTLNSTRPRVPAHCRWSWWWSSTYCVLCVDTQARARTDDKKVVAFFTAHEKVSAASQLQPFVQAGSMDRRLVAGADTGLHQLHEQAAILVEQLPANIIEYVAM